MDRLSTYNRWFKEQVQVGLNQIERGDIVTHEEVGERLFARIVHGPQDRLPE